MRIRNYQKADYHQVAVNLKEAELFDEIWDSESNLTGMIENDFESIMVAEEDSQIIGNIFIIPYGTKISYIFRLAVKNNHRKQGVASELIKYAIESLKKKGISEVGLYVDSGNLELQSFYKKRGFQISTKSYFYMWNELKEN